MLSFDINLDLGPVKKFTHLVNKFDIEYISQQYDKIYKSFIKDNYLDDQQIRNTVITYRYRIPYLDELQYWSNIFNSQLHKMLILQYIFEMDSYSTTIISKISNCYTMIRTFDSVNDLAKIITYYGNYYRNNKIIYQGITWLGSIGLFTAKSFSNSYAVSLNTRILSNIHNKHLVHNFINYLHTYYSSSVLLRLVMENCMTLNETKIILSKYRLIQPVYYIVTDFKTNHFVIKRSSTSSQIYYNNEIVQTNHDNLYSFNYYNTFTRQIIASDIIKYNYGFENIIENLMNYPIYSNNTIYLAIMDLHNFNII